MSAQKKRIRVITVTCPVCTSEMYSRARYDYHGCQCGTFVDGGFDYCRFGWPNGTTKPKQRIRYVGATRRELYEDWRTESNIFGFIGETRYVNRTPKRIISYSR